MNLLPLLLGFVFLNGMKKKDNKQGFDLSGILSNPELLSLLPHVAKLFDKTATDEDKNLAIMNLMTNPAIFDIMQKFASQKSDENQHEDNDSQKQNNKNGDDSHQQSDDSDDCTDNKINDKCDDKQQNDSTQKQMFSDESKEFFRPVEKVAGVEISQKLYGLYDNWYIKK